MDLGNALRNQVARIIAKVLPQHMPVVVVTPMMFTKLFLKLEKSEKLRAGQ